MGVDLALLPIQGEHDGEQFAWSILDLEGCRELFDAIGEVEQVSGEAIGHLTSYRGRLDSGTGYGPTLTTPYGEAVKTVTAGALLKLRHHEGVRDNDRNRAAWAYLAAQDPTTKIALYWY